MCNLFRLAEIAQTNDKANEACKRIIAVFRKVALEEKARFEEDIPRDAYTLFALEGLVNDIEEAEKSRGRFDDERTDPKG